MHLEVHLHLAQVLDKVVGERIVIIDYQNHILAGSKLARVGTTRQQNLASPGSLHQFLGICQNSPKNPALAIPPGARDVAGTSTSTMAKSGSLGTWRALFR